VALLPPALIASAIVAQTFVCAEPGRVPRKAGLLHLNSGDSLDPRR
jgi:hypothetical protein